MDARLIIYSYLPLRQCLMDISIVSKTDNLKIKNSRIASKGKLFEYTRPTEACLLHYHKLETEIARITPILQLCDEIKIPFRTENQNTKCLMHKPDEEMARFTLALPEKFENNKISLLANALKEDKPYDMGRFC